MCKWKFRVEKEKVHSVKTEYGELNLTIPRDRNGELSQQTLPAYKRTNDSLETTIIQLFQKGITMAEISELIEKMYGHYYTPQTISNMSKLVSEDVLAFKGKNIRIQLFRYLYGAVKKEDTLMLEYFLFFDLDMDEMQDAMKVIYW